MNEFNKLVPQLKYRPDIDGLRALAVLAVVFHHLSARLFPGGYVGVDVFFVISGYFDPITWMCNEQCVVESDGVALYRDAGHLSVAGAMRYQPDIESTFAQLK